MAAAHEHSEKHLPEDGIVIESPDVLGRLLHWETKSESVGREAVEARLDAWHARIEALRVQVHLAGMDARRDAPSALARLDAKLDQARDRLRELDRWSQDVWTVLSETYESVRAEVIAGEHLIAENRR